ncbi:PREDICTED: olfactory receptor 52A5-like [Nanorana parkeri]|uniref:olfactory receptor 52A5-like n=1 Tax=Nanorana parkeri TaxID=125878 RepID=UPI00085442B0|nr:PREDICTED: olfactory receptor 52A5-like [Nanorana parkeri]
MTQLSTYKEKTVEAVRTSLLIVMLLGFCFFLYFIKSLLSVYFTTEHIRDNSRYILFAHMLITDTVYLFLCFFLAACSLYFVYLPFSVCYTTVAATTTSFIVTPYNLAVMSLERYVAICFPLRHAEICSVQNTCIAVAVMWVVGLVSPTAELIVLLLLVKKDVFSLKVQCSSMAIMIVPPQNSLRFLSIVLSLSAVGTIHMLTYIKVVIAAKKVSSGTSSASKAGRTVMLHAFQLLLCMTSLFSSFIDMTFADSIVFLRMAFFFVFMFLPRFLSPLIYGLRDEVFRKYLKKLRSK